MEKSVLVPALCKTEGLIAVLGGEPRHSATWVGMMFIEKQYEKLVLYCSLRTLIIFSEKCPDILIVPMNGLSDEECFLGVRIWQEEDQQTVRRYIAQDNTLAANE